MNRFAALLDRLAYEPGRNAKLRLLTDYSSSAPRLICRAGPRGRGGNGSAIRSSWTPC
jgi:hypothetical protein